MTRDNLALHGNECRLWRVVCRADLHGRERSGAQRADGDADEA